MTGVLIKGGTLGTDVHTQPCAGSCPAALRQELPEAGTDPALRGALVSMAMR